jgi:hypothetical protein
MQSSILNRKHQVSRPVQVSPSVISAVEGSSVTFTVSTKWIPDNTTLYYTLDTDVISAGDVSATSGTITIVNNTASFVITITQDYLIESTESFRVRIRQGSTSGQILASSKIVLITDGAFVAAYRDESDYNLTMTPAAGVSIDSNERPFAGVYSGYFPSSAGAVIGTYGIIINNAILALGTGDFCVELWAKSSTTVSTSAGLFSGSTIGGAAGVAIGRDIHWTGNNSETVARVNVPINHPFGWSHIAFIRSGSTIRSYIDGTQIGATSGYLRNLTATKYAICHRYADGSFSSLNGAVWLGWLTNIRIVKGYSVYSGNFSAPTAPVLQSGALSASAYPSTTNVDTTFPRSACVFLTNFRQ